MNQSKAVELIENNVKATTEISSPVREAVDVIKKQARNMQIAKLALTGDVYADDEVSNDE